MQLPLATTDPDAEETAKLIKLHGNIAKRVFVITATRDGLPPMLPTMEEKLTDANGIKEVLSDTDIKMKAPMLGPGAMNQQYSVQAFYTYLLARSPKPDEKLRIGSLPFDRLKASEHWLDLSKNTDFDNQLQVSGTSW